MKCPECKMRIHQSAEECPHCGTHMGVLKESFSDFETMVINGVQDVAGVLRKKMKRDLEKASLKCEKKFKNVHVACSFVALPAGRQLESYGLWLLNNGVFQRDGVAIEDKSTCLLLVVDVNQKLLGMVYGYQYDGYMTKRESFDVLARGHASFLEGDYVRGIEDIFAGLPMALRVAYRRAKKGKEVWK